MTARSKKKMLPRKMRPLSTKHCTSGRTSGGQFQLHLIPIPIHIPNLRWGPQTLALDTQMSRELRKKSRMRCSDTACCTPPQNSRKPAPSASAMTAAFLPLQCENARLFSKEER